MILLHGWPHDIHTYVDVAPLLAAAGHRVIVPHLRGYRLAQAPLIGVPTITPEGDANGAAPEPGTYAKKLSGPYEHRLVSGGIGHNLPQEAPEAFAAAVVDAMRL